MLESKADSAQTFEAAVTSLQPVFTGTLGIGRMLAQYDHCRLRFSHSATSVTLARPAAEVSQSSNPSEIFK